MTYTDKGLGTYICVAPVPPTSLKSETVRNFTRPLQEERLRDVGIFLTGCC